MKIIKWVIGVVAISLVSGLMFYWFEWRRAEIRKLCSKPDFEESERLLGRLEGVEKLDQMKAFSLDNFNSFYRFCLARHGLKPENLYSGE